MPLADARAPVPLVHPAQPPVLVSLLGPSGAGKTTLAARLVAYWQARGLRVGYGKHASHGFQMDREGKDTWVLSEAGASGVAVTGPGGTAFLERGPEAAAATLVDRFFGTHHVVVLEGFRSAALPAVVVAAAETADAVLATARGAVVALATPDGRGPAGVPAVARDDVAAVASLVEAALFPASLRRVGRREG